MIYDLEYLRDIPRSTILFLHRESLHIEQMLHLLFWWFCFWHFKEEVE